MAKDVKMSYIESDIEKIKTKPNQYIQEYNEDGAFHLSREIIQNAIDELNDPDSEGSTIEIKYDIATDIMSCEDDGRAIPEVDYPLDIFCTKIQSGSKFDRSQSGASSGEFGIGITAVNALSDIFNMTTYREKEGIIHELKFESGIKVKDKISNQPKNKVKHGTYVAFRASKKYLGPDTKLPYKKVIKWLDTLMYFHMENKKIKIRFDVYDGMKLKETYKFKLRNFDELLDTVIPEKVSPKLVIVDDKIITEMDHNQKKKKMIHLDIALTYQNDSNTYYDSYCNFTHTKMGGIHVDTFDKVFCNYMQTKVKSTMTDNQKEKYPIIWDDIRSGLTCIINVSTNASVRFEGNMKEKISGDVLIEPMTEMIISNLDKYFSKNQSVFNTYSNIIKINSKARIESQAIKTAVKTEKMSNLSEHSMENYIPCTNTGKQWKECFCVEGNSAGGSCRDASDPKTQAIFLLRGVVPNAFKCTLAQIMENREIRSLVTIMRCGIGKNFDISKMYFNRINIFTDEDTDGFYISGLLLAFFYKFMPELIQNGYIWKVYTPLYQLTDNTFIGSKSEMTEVNMKKLIKNYKIKLVGQKDYMSKSEFREFLTDTYTYADDLRYAAESLGNINKYLLETITANLTISNDISDLDKLLTDQKFIKIYMSNVQKRYKEIILKNNTIRGVADGKYCMIHLSHRFLDKVDTIIPIYKKYGYEVIVKEKEREPIKMTLGEFMDSASKYYADILHRFKGLSEINAKDLHDNAMDFNHRYSVVYTMESAKKELEKFMILFADTSDYPEKRKDMMVSYKINREDLDN